MIFFIICLHLQMFCVFSQVKKDMCQQFEQLFVFYVLNNKIVYASSHLNCLIFFIVYNIECRIVHLIVKIC